MTSVVIGIGNPYRRDDGVGPAVADEIARQSIPGLRVLGCVAEPTALLEAWDGTAAAVIVDAAAGGTPGRVRRCTLDELADMAPVSSHDLNLAQTYELGRVLGRAPQSVAVVTVDAADLGHGSVLSPDVAAAVPRAAALVLAELARMQAELVAPLRLQGE